VRSFQPFVEKSIRQKSIRTIQTKKKKTNVFNSLFVSIRESDYNSNTKTAELTCRRLFEKLIN
jgi:hypothetical protein